jgi:hypothetical protein
MIAYTVSCTFTDAAVGDEWIAWLRDEHLAEVRAAAPGILDAEVIRFDGTPLRCEVRYHFASREAFDAYERDHAPRLRAEGLKRFPPQRGLKYERTLGEVVHGGSDPSFFSWRCG